jgi:hypothetical protein
VLISLVKGAAEKMVKKYSIVNKRLWLEEFEKGYSESQIASKNHCDVRTLKKGIEEAQHEREARSARIEILKNALLEHQEKLKDKLKEIYSLIILPPTDWAVLEWYRNRDSILKESDSDRNEPFIREDLIYELLKEHLKQDVLWKTLTAWKQAYSSHRNARIELQRRIISILESTTGLPMVDKPGNQSSFLYSYIAGDLFYRKTLRCAFGSDETTDWLNDIVVEDGEVRLGGSVISVAPGKEKECQEALVESFRGMQTLPESNRVVNTFKLLEEAVVRAGSAIEDVLILGMVTGRCRVCHKLMV